MAEVLGNRRGGGRARADQDCTRRSGAGGWPSLPAITACRARRAARRSSLSARPSVRSRTRPRSTDGCERRSPSSECARRRQRLAAETGLPRGELYRRALAMRDGESNETAAAAVHRCAGSGRNAAGASRNGSACGICGCGAGASSRATGVAPPARSTSWRGAAACSRSSRSSRETKSTRRHRRCCRGRGGGSPAPPKLSCCRAPISPARSCDST